MDPRRFSGKLAVANLDSRVGLDHRDWTMWSHGSSNPSSVADRAMNGESSGTLRTRYVQRVANANA